MARNCKSRQSAVETRFSISFFSKGSNKIASEILIYHRSVRFSRNMCSDSYSSFTGKNDLQHRIAYILVFTGKEATMKHWPLVLIKYFSSFKISLSPLLLLCLYWLQISIAKWSKASQNCSTTNTKHRHRYEYIVADFLH